MSLRRWIGLGGLAFFALNVIGFVLFLMAGPPPGLDPAEKLVTHYKTHEALLTTTILAYDLSFIPFLVFVTGLAVLIRRAGPSAELLAAIVFGLGVFIVAGGYVDFALIGAAVADGGGASNPSTVRTLAEASAYLANTPFTIPLLFFMAIAGYAIWHPVRLALARVGGLDWRGLDRIDRAFCLWWQ